MDTKERILLAAQELYYKYGIRSVSMDDIAKHLSISKKTIYKFYNEKDELVIELMKIKIKEDQKKFKELEEESDNVVEETIKLMKHVGKLVGEVNPNFFYDIQKYHPKAWDIFIDFKVQFILKMVEDVLVRGIKQGLIRPEINVKILARLRMEEIEIGFNPAVFPLDKFKMLEVQLSILEHFLYGVCSLKGHKLINKYKQITEEE